MPPLDSSGPNDWITATAPPASSATQSPPSAPTAGGDANDWITATAPPEKSAPAALEAADQAVADAPQTQTGADISSVAQGLVKGTGAVIAGAGRLAQAGTGPSAERVLAAFDLVDEGKKREAYQLLSGSERQQVGAYRGATPDDKAAQRASLQQAIDDYAKPNMVTRAGMAVEDAAPQMFPIDQAKEGFQTGVGKIVGSVGPALVAGAAGGPAGILAGMAAIGTQTYDSTYQEATAKGATHAEADDAAGKSAVTQAALSVVPIGGALEPVVGRVLQLVPVALREGFVKTLMNMGVHGVEVSSFNGLSTLAGNYVAQQTYDPSRPITQGVGDAGMEGFAAGLVIRGGTAAAGAIRPQATIADIGKAPDIDSAITAAGEAANAPVDGQGAADIPTMTIHPDAAPAADGVPTMTIRPGDADPGLAADVMNPPGSRPAGYQEPAAATGPQPGGADITNPALIPELTPAQKATALQKMVNQSAEDRITPGGRDDTVYVPGVERPEAMKDFSPAVGDALSSALEHKKFYNTDSAYHDQFDATVTRNNNIMVDGLHDMFGDANTREVAMNDAKELMPGSVHLFDDQKPVDAQPIVDTIKSILAGPAGKRGAVETQLNSLLPKLLDANGNLETMPSMLKGIRDDITDRLYDKTPSTEGNAARTAKNQLRDVLHVVDNTIADGLPGTKYQDYLSNLSDALGRVSKLDYLQRFLTGSRKLTDLRGQLVFSKVQRLLEDIQAHHADQTGGAKELSMSEIGQIEAVRNELAAKDMLDRRAAVRASPTVQLANASGILGSGPLGAAVKGGASLATHLLLAKTTGGLGNAALLTHQHIIKPAQARSAQQAADNAAAAAKARLLDTTPRLDAP